MVAYSFAPRFRAPILAGTKLQTIRADRKRHARSGEVLQLYTGMRTRHCRLIGTATCASVTVVTLNLAEGIVVMPRRRITPRSTGFALERFAQSDGFATWAEMVAFWAVVHPNVDVFSGVLIWWMDLVPAPS